MTNNVLETNKTDNISETSNVSETGELKVKRGRGRPRNLHPTKYWGKGGYYNITLHLVPSAGVALRKMAEEEKTPIGQLASEAIATWIKWLARAARDEAKQEGKEEDIISTEKEFQEAFRLLKSIKQEIKMVKMKKAYYREGEKTKKLWEKYHGGAWPGPPMPVKGIYEI